MDRARQWVAFAVAGVLVFVIVFDSIDSVLWGNHYEPPPGFFTFMAAAVGALFAPDVARFIKGKSGKE